MLSARRMFLSTRQHTGILDRRIRREQAKFEEILAPGVVPSAADAGGHQRKSPAMQAGDAPCEPLVEYQASSRPAGNAERVEFADLVAPLSSSAFFNAQAESPRPMLFRGDSTRFAHLVGWRDIDKLLFSGRRDASRIRVVMDGQSLPASLFCKPSLAWDYQHPEPVIDDRKLLAFLREGATLIVNRVQQSLDRVSDLTDVLAGAAHYMASANLYVSWQSTQGFNTHWDDHDVFVVQVRGEKNWQMYGVTRVSPLKRDLEENSPPPKEPQWSGRLTAGDVLFIPRGWWHDARGMEAQGLASVHLSCHIGSRTGSDIFAWLMRQMLRDESFRRELPLLAGNSRLGAHIETLRNSLQGLVRERTAKDWAKLLKDEFQTGLGWDAGARTGPSLDPWRRPDWHRYVLRLRGREHCGLRFDRGEGAVYLAANGATVEFDPYCFPLVQLLSEREAITVHELKALDPIRFTDRFVDDFTKHLIRNSLVSAALPQ